MDKDLGADRIRVELRTRPPNSHIPGKVLGVKTLVKIFGASRRVIAECS